MKNAKLPFCSNYMLLENDKEQKIFRHRSRNGIGVLDFANNIMLAERDWDNSKLLKYIKQCVSDAEEDLEQLHFAHKGCIAEMTAVLFRYAVNHCKEGDSIWNIFIRMVEKLITKKEETVVDLIIELEKWEKTLYKAYRYVQKEEVLKETGELVLFLWIQFMLMSDFVSKGKDYVLLKELNAKWIPLEAQAKECLKRTECYVKIAEVIMEDTMTLGTNDAMKDNTETVFEEANKEEAKDGAEDMKILGMDSFPEGSMNASAEETAVAKCKKFLAEWNPEKIQAYLDEYIAGQEAAKTEFAHLCYEHAARIANLDLNIRKSNYVMYGPTGSGKTELARVINEIFPIPIEVVDASAITTNGFKGADAEDVMLGLAQTNPWLMYSIVILDEFDKLCIPSYDSQGGNVNKLLQGQLLKMIEGTMMRKYGYDYCELDTSRITFICAGAFEGAFQDKVKNGLGFGSQAVSLNDGKTAIQCLEDFGMIPELAGRICSVIPLKNLDEKDLFEILTSKKNNCLENIRKLYKAAYSSRVIFTEDALHEVCSAAVANGLGARGMGGIVEAVCHRNRRKYTGKNNVLRITGDMVREYCFGGEYSACSGYPSNQRDR